MLSDQSRPVIEQTIGVVAERIPFITPEFYRSMFEARPDLLDGMFSRSNQKNGTQAQALAGSAQETQRQCLHPAGEHGCGSGLLDRPYCKLGPFDGGARVAPGQ